MGTWDHQKKQDSCRLERCLGNAPCCTRLLIATCRSLSSSSPALRQTPRMPMANARCRAARKPQVVCHVRPCKTVWLYVLRTQPCCPSLQDSDAAVGCCAHAVQDCRRWAGAHRSHGALATGLLACWDPGLQRASSCGQARSA